LKKKNQLKKGTGHRRKKGLRFNLRWPQVGKLKLKQHVETRKKGKKGQTCHSRASTGAISFACFGDYRTKATKESNKFLGEGKRTQNSEKEKAQNKPMQMTSECGKGQHWSKEGKAEVGKNEGR